MNQKDAPFTFNLFQ